MKFQDINKVADLRREYEAAEERLKRYEEYDILSTDSFHVKFSQLDYSNNYFAQLKVDKADIQLKQELWNLLIVQTKLQIKLLMDELIRLGVEAP